MAIQRSEDPRRKRYLIVGAFAATAFFASYSYASSKTGGTGSTLAPGSPYAAAGVAAGGGAACACCGGPATSEPVEGSASVEGAMQRIAIDTSTGGYVPNVIRAKAGVPLEITFGQASGCLAQVQSEQLGFFEDLTGGPRTVRLAGLAPGEYGFACGMDMVFGKILVE